MRGNSFNASCLLFRRVRATPFVSVISLSSAGTIHYSFRVPLSSVCPRYLTLNSRYIVVVVNDRDYPERQFKESVSI